MKPKNMPTRRPGRPARHSSPASKAPARSSDQTPRRDSLVHELRAKLSAAQTSRRRKSPHEFKLVVKDGDIRVDCDGTTLGWVRNDGRDLVFSILVSLVNEADTYPDARAWCADVARDLAVAWRKRGYERCDDNWDGSSRCFMLDMWKAVADLKSVVAEILWAAAQNRCANIKPPDAT